MLVSQRPRRQGQKNPQACSLRRMSSNSRSGLGIHRHFHLSYFCTDIAKASQKRCLAANPNVIAIAGSQFRSLHPEQNKGRQD